MCWCTPSLRTPCCGKMGCNPENNEQVPPSVGSVGWQEHSSSEGGHGQMNSLLENSQLSLWQNYCDKKMECEEWEERFYKTFNMLEYAHSTGECHYDHKGVNKFIEKMYLILRGK